MEDTTVPETETTFDGNLAFEEVEDDVEIELNNVTDTETINESTLIPDIQKDSKKVQFDMSTVQI